MENHPGYQMARSEEERTLPKYIRDWMDADRGNYLALYGGRRAPWHLLPPEQRPLDFK